MGDRGKLSLEDSQMHEIADSSADLQIDAEFNRLWAENVLDRALDKLKGENENYFTSVRLLYLEGKSYEQIAGTMGVEEPKIKNYIHRGKARLGDFIKQFIREYSGSSAEFETELRDLREFLAVS